MYECECGFEAADYQTYTQHLNNDHDGIAPERWAAEAEFDRYYGSI